MSLTDTSTAETRVVQFNPERLKGKLENLYADLEVPGATGQLQQFRLLKNAVLDVDLRFDALISRDWNSDKITDFLNFVLSLATPRQGDSVGDIDPPYCLFVWPRLYTLVARVRSPTWEDLRFANTGARTLTTISFQLHQFVSFRRTSEDMRKRGLNA